MPEGHVIHRLARETGRLFAGRQVAVSSPQGRFAQSAALLDGHMVASTEAWGKHLFVRFDAPIPDSIVHVHLGLIGRLRFASPGEAIGQVRLRIATPQAVADLVGPQECRLITPSDLDERVARLGADPLRPDADPERAWARIHRSRKSIAALLMDQAVTAGVGNIFRAEVLFRHRIDPATPGTALRPATWRTLWEDLVEVMTAALASGRIDTVYPEHLPEAMGRPPRVDRHGGEVYVYRRAGAQCYVCGTPVSSRTLEGRALYWCQTCQHGH